MQATTDKTPKPIRLRINSTWKPHNDTTNGLDSSVWIPRFKMIKPSQPLNELLPMKMKSYVNYYAKKDETLSTLLAGGKDVVVISCTLRVHGPSGTLIIPLNKDPRVKIVGDLPVDRYPPQPISITAILTLTLQPRRKSRRQTVDPNDLIQTTAYPEDRHEESLKWCHVGNVKIFDEEGTAVCAQRKPRIDHCIAYSNPLIASYDSQAQKVRLYRLRHAYYFNQFIIGDLNERQAWNKLGSDVELFDGMFGHPSLELESVEDLFEKVVRYLEFNHGIPEEDNSRNEHPFLPTFCYNAFHAEEARLGVETWPKDDVDLAVRCVNHYTPTRELLKVEFPRDIRLSIKEAEDMSDLVKDISEHIDFAGLLDGVNVDSKKLFDRKHKGKWEMEFWVMPQRQMKLFRYSQGKLDQFLDPSKLTRVLDKRLYCEAHIVPKKR